MTDPARVTVTPRREDAQEFASIISLVQLGRVTEAWDRFRASCLAGGPLARFGGAVVVALEAGPTPPPQVCVVDVVHWGDESRHVVGDFSAPVTVRLDVPADAPAVTRTGSVAVYDYPDSTLRMVSLSRHSCDTRAADPTGERGPLAVAGAGAVASLVWTVADTDGVAPMGEVMLARGATYYITMWAPHAGAGAPMRGGWEVRWPR